MNKGLKVTLISVFVILMIACLGIDFWYLYILNHGSNKVVSSTYKVGLQTTTNGDSKYFVEVNSYNNMFEVKFNYLLDETQTAFYSQGIQIFSDSNDGIGFYHKVDEDSKAKTSSSGWWFWKETSYKVFVNITGIGPNQDVYNYASGDNWSTVINSANPITSDSRFKIQLGNDLYLMEFKGEKYSSFDKLNYFSSEGSSSEWYEEYAYYDVNFFVYKLFESIQTLPYGTNQAVIFEFGDMFNYYKHIEDSVYSSEPLKDTELVKRDMKSYYSIKVSKHDGNAEKSSDSIMNTLNGSQNYNSSNIISNDYFIGRTIIETNLSHFNFVNVTETSVALKLREDFIECYTQDKYKDKIYLSVLIDLDKLAEDGKTFLGFTADNGLSNFTIISCQTVETIDGELVYSEVAYA